MLSDTVLLHVWWNSSFVKVCYVSEWYCPSTFRQSEISAQTHEYLSSLLRTAFQLNIQDRLQVKALLSVVFIITGRVFFVLFWELEAHRTVFYVYGSSHHNIFLWNNQQIQICSQFYSTARFRREGGHWGDQDVDERIILRWNFRKL